MSVTSDSVGGAPERQVWTNARRGAFGQLSAATLAGRPVTALVGPSGIGKSTLLGEWRKQILDSTAIYRMEDPTGNLNQDVAALSRAFGVEGGAEAVSQIASVLNANADDAKLGILVIENAHKLSGTLLVAIADLIEQSQGGSLPLQLLLTGDESLADALGDDLVFPDVEIVSLPGLTATGTAELFKHGLAGDLVVGEGVLDAVQDLTGGNPGQIIALAEIARQMQPGGNILTEQDFALMVDGLQGRVPNGETDPSAVPADVKGPESLPSPITESANPREMLRWAFGLGDEEDDEEHVEPGATLSLPPVRAAPSDVGSLQEALAEIAARENAQRQGPPVQEAMPELPFGGKVDPSRFRHGAEGLAGIVQRERRFKPIPREKLEDGPPMAPPEQLKDRLLAEDSPPRRRGRSLVIAGGLVACFVAGAFGWPILRGVMLPTVPGADVPSGPVAALPPGPPGIFSDPVQAFSPDPQAAMDAPAVVLAGPIDAATAEPAPALKNLQIAAANPYQTEEQSRTAAILGADERQRAMNAAASQAADRLAAIEDQIKSADARLAMLRSEEDLVISDIATLRREQVDLSGQADDLRAEIEELAAAHDAGADLEARNTALELELETAQARLAALGADASALTAKNEAQRDALAALEASLAERTANLSDLDAALGENGPRLEVASARLAQVQDAISVAEAEEKRTAEVLAESEARLQDVLAAVARAQETLVSLEAEQQRRGALLADVETSEAVLRDLENRKAALRTELDSVQAALTTQNLELEKAREASALVSAAKADLESLEAQKLNASQDLAALTSQVAAVQSRLDDLRQTRRQVQDDAAAGANSLRDIEARREAAQADLASIMARQAAAEAEVLVLQKASAAAEATKSEIEEAVVSLTARRQDVEAQVAEAQASLAAVQASLEQARADLAEATLTRETVKDDHASALEAQAQVYEELERAKGESATVQADLASLAEKRDALMGEMDELSALVAADTARRTVALTTIETTRSELSRIGDDLDASRAELTTIEAQKLDAEQAVASLVQRAAAAAEDLERLQAERDSTSRTLAGEREQLVAARNELAAARSMSTAMEAELAMKLEALEDAESRLSVVLARLQEFTPKPLPESAQPLEARSARDVDAALQAAPGLDALTEGQAESLRAALIDGYCVADALKAVTGRANPFTVRALRGLIGACGG